MIVGLFNDRWGSKKYGRRFPWIISFGVVSAISWFIMSAYIPTDSSIYGFLMFYLFFVMLGIAFADTALDGLILDVVPKEKLATVQGYTWSMLLLGMGAGGMLLGYVFLLLDLMHILFIITGILVILACFFPYFIEELPIDNVSRKEWGQDLLTFITKKKNWKIFLYTFMGAIQAVLILEFFKYAVLIPMGVLDVNQTLVSLTGESTPEGYQAWNSIFYLSNGIGTFVFSIFAGRYSDKGRRNASRFFYLTYIPFCIISIIPFLFIADFLPALFIGLIFILLFGGLQGALVVTNQTIRADLAKHDYPNLKSTYYALLISFSNAGQNIGSLAGAWILNIAILITTNYNIIYFLVAVFCAFCLTISFLIFRSLDPADYELGKVLKTSEDIFFT
jgi:MFS family permease